MSSRSESELKKMKLADLKKLCTTSSLPTTGSKQELIDRIMVYEATKSSLTVAPEEEAELLDEDDTSIGDVSHTIPIGVPSVEKSQTEVEEKPTTETKSDEARTASAEVVKLDVSKMTMEERIAYRKQRFGGTSDASSNGPSRPIVSDPDLEKRLERAKRFGLPVVVAPKSETERVKTRAERFGTKPTKIIEFTPEELERKRKRLERFGETMANEEKKKLERAVRFGLTEVKKPKTESSA
ncbi:unnamed protein product [Hymenolepis diminuta]|uniref:SAP domain-containing protein n=1 Tax=Hymenolepis diminuta TaxID=6216 RepID=A0A0R3SDX5_HYMDI|nr:unnamed protein product [Hymenolepis diminuta]VUZ39794.1 unnamed protein product [Hymenolepis diminuta]